MRRSKKAKSKAAVAARSNKSGTHKTTRIRGGSNSKHSKHSKRNLENEVESYLSEFDALSPEEQDQLLMDLSGSVTQQPDDFVCSVLKAPLTAPCSCNGCGFHTESETVASHCLLRHRFDLGLDTFSIEQLSTITDIPSSRIKSSVDAAFNLIRKHNIQVEIDTGNYNRFSYRGGIDVCVVCSAQVPKRPFVVDPTSDLRYCSRPCYKKRPPSLIRLEIEFGVDIRVILTVARKVLKRLPLIASTLDVKRKLLLHWYDEFLGINASVFGSDAVDVVDVMRRSNPKHSWAIDFLKQPHAKLRTHIPPRIIALEAECNKLCKSL